MSEGAGKMRPCCRRLEGGIKTRGMRMTIPRQLIAEALEGSDGYQSAEEIYSIIREDYPAIGLATVYRTLVLMEDMGLVRRCNFGEGITRYITANNQNDRYQHQIICEKCYKVMKCSELSEREILLYKEVEQNLASKYGFEIKRQVVQFFGLCPDCQNKNSTTGE